MLDAVNLRFMHLEVTEGVIAGRTPQADQGETTCQVCLAFQ